MDPLSDIVALLRPHAALSKPITGRGAWGVRYAAYGQPGFAIVLSGQCWLALDMAEPVRLERGDFVLLPSTPAFALFSEPGVAPVLVEPSEKATRHGEIDGEPDVEMLGGAFQVEQVNAPLLLGLLPRMIHIRAVDGGAGRISGIVGLIMDECAADRAGRDMILQRLLEVMLVECLRWHGVEEGVWPTGLLAGMRDPAMAKVLRALHSDVRAGWTVADLADLAGMSRSSFANRFAEALGCAPIEYLARWRMALAQDALNRGARSLERLAEEIGYESASAFSTAFRRRIGCSPRAFARACRTDNAASSRSAAA
ncbi:MULTISPECIES: AraC family transcriptional regulator [unclassified Bosea (in: a-proteobacteria)]|uniref:AraC family transcriptional regulator n=1 Tax=unclassified Bosea (in: a-proteobacteria) TaxID=2653178 RepID=UPI000F762088|nr:MULTISPECIES: AraC family transcriptional regulator [unclassified Bosea (in: a-proteobacteria)]AZO78145.1 AraC family transcriptional regulator [Bosea sp. Tri-49]RXT20374.1 AraC family transcriptional regulator [Bosea sp. Tri-39]RXT37246.1 AraC family transcriptional regulator [Bosea sp. Tri-54]